MIGSKKCDASNEHIGLFFVTPVSRRRCRDNISSCLHIVFLNCYLLFIISINETRDIDNSILRKYRVNDYYL